jgi:hypothetical protein
MRTGTAKERSKAMRMKTVWILPCLLLMLAVTITADAVASSSMSQIAGMNRPAEVGHTKQITGRIDYQHVGSRGETDDQGRRLIWEGTIEGDLTGTMKWWFGQSPAPTTNYRHGRVAYYVGRWEIWDASGRLLVAGESAGKTVLPDGEDGIWDGHGVVTEAGGRLDVLKGRRISETGPVLLGPVPSGTGIFVIY